MDPELLELARVSATALHLQAVAATQTNWAEVVSAGVGIGQLVLIAWGLRQMKVSSEERSNQMKTSSIVCLSPWVEAFTLPGPIRGARAAAGRQSAAR